MAKGTKKTVVTKKHLARVERERLQNRYILIGSIAIIAIVVFLLGFGIVQQYVVWPKQPVARVGDEVITTEQFQLYARYQRLQIIQQYNQYQQFASLFGSDPSNQSFMLQYLSQINFQLEPSVLGQSTLDALIEDYFIRQYAEANNIRVTEEEVDKAIQDVFGFYPNGTPTPKPTTQVIPTSTLSPTQIFLLTPPATATPVITATVAVTETTAITATTAITETGAVTETSVLTPTLEPTPAAPTATPLPQPTPTEYTEDSFQDNYRQYIRDLGNIIGFSERDLRWIFEMQLLREKVFEEITKDAVREQDQVWARHILVADEETANQVLERLAAGEDFAALAVELSIDTATAPAGGDLGWFGLGKMDSEFEKVAFNLNVGQISDVVLTQFGYHIIQVLGHEVRQLSSSDFDQYRQEIFQDWVQSQRDTTQPEIYDIWMERVPTSPTLPPTQPVQAFPGQ